MKKNKDNDSNGRLYTHEEILKIYEDFNIILNDVINIYEQEIANVYYQNTFKNKIKRNIKKIYKRRKHENIGNK